MRYTHAKDASVFAGAWRRRAVVADPWFFYRAWRPDAPAVSVMALQAFPAPGVLARHRGRAVPDARRSTVPSGGTTGCWPAYRRARLADDEALAISGPLDQAGRRHVNEGVDLHQSASVGLISRSHFASRRTNDEHAVEGEADAGCTQRARHLRLGQR